MDGAKKKLKKIQPLIKIRQAQFEQNQAELLHIQSELKKATTILRSFQNMYVQGIEKLNKERQSSERKMLEALELSVDYAKGMWYEKLSALRVLEQNEKQQLKEVFESQKRLKMIEKIQERYVINVYDVDRKNEQKNIDEYALQSSVRKNLD